MKNNNKIIMKIIGITKKNGNTHYNIEKTLA